VRTETGFLLLASILVGCGGGQGRANDAGTDVAVDAPGADMNRPDGPPPIDAAVDAAGDLGGNDGPSPVDATADTAGDLAGSDGPVACEGGPPATFVDGFVWLRDLHVGPGQTYSQLPDAAAVAVPGDRIVVHAGTYPPTFIADLQGTEALPIAISAATGEASPVFTGSGTCLQLSTPAYVLVEGITVDTCTANGLNIDDGGNTSVPAGPIVIRDVTIRDIGPSGNLDGLKMSGIDDFVVYGNTIERWGDGGSGIDMVGCHDGLITSNILTHTAGLTGGSGVQAKGGSRNVEIRGNLFENAGSRGVNMGGSTGDQFFRPPAAGYEAHTINVLANVFIGSRAPVAFVGCEGSCLVAHNTIYATERWVLRILNERPDLVPETRDGRFLYNIVMVDSALATFVNVGGDTDGESFSFDGNLWFDLDDPGFTMTDVPNDAGLTLTQTNALVQVDPQFENPAARDFSLDPGSPAVGQAPALAERSLDYELKCYLDPASLGAVEQP